MVLSRVSSIDLAAATAAATAKVDQLRAVLAPLVVSDLSDRERARTLRTPCCLPDVAREMLAISGPFPQVLAAAGYDPAESAELLQKLGLLAGLASSLAAIQRWIDDSRLVWESELYRRNLAVYNVAKPLARTDGTLRPLVEPMEQMFRAMRKRRKVP